ncbi:MAG: MarR family transcriptional regulator [Pseudomonadota bacterium]
MTKAYRIAQELDRVRRKLDVQMNKRMPLMDTGNIGHNESLLLLQLADLQGASIQELAEKMGRDHSQTARVIKQLEGKGAIRRARNPADKRETSLHVTDYGDIHLQEIRDELTEIVEEALGTLSEAEQNLLLDLLSRI